MACHGLDGRRFDEWLEREASGFSPHWLDVRLFGKQARFSAVAVRTSRAESTKFRHRIPNEDAVTVTRDWEQMHNLQQYRSLWDWQYADGGQTWRTRLWRKDGVGFTQYHTPAQRVVQEAENALRIGAVVRCITPCLAPGSSQFIITTEDTRRPCLYSLDASRDPLKHYTEEVEAKGWSLDQITAYERGGAERFIVVLSKDANKAHRTAEWEIPQGRLAERIQEQKRKGFMPWCLTAYGSFPFPEYAVLWCRFEAKPLPTKNGPGG